MSRRELLEKIDGQIKLLTGIDQQINYVCWGYQSDRRMLVAQIIKEEGLLLENATWQYKPTAYSSCPFQLDCNQTWDNFPRLVKLVKPEYHDSLPLVFQTREESSSALSPEDRAAQERLAKQQAAQQHYQDWGKLPREVATLHFSDGEMSIRFEDIMVGLKFLEDWSIPLTYSDLEDDLAAAKQKVDHLTTLLEKARKLTTHEAAQSD